MTLATNDPIFDAPVLDFLNPVTTWTERDDNDATIKVAVIVARAVPTRNREVVRAEITNSPAYIKACNGRKVMVSREELGEQLIDWTLGGHDVKMTRVEVRCSLLDIIAMQEGL